MNAMNTNAYNDVTDAYQPTEDDIQAYNASCAAALYTRDGDCVTSNIRRDDGSKGKPYIVVATTCGRCGGLGGGTQWAHTGWTCFECGGTGKGTSKIAKLYTEEQLAKLNASQARRDAKKVAEIAEVARKQAAEIAEKRSAFDAANGELVSWLLSHAEGNDFLTSLADQLTTRGQLSPRQVEVLAAAKIKSEITKPELHWRGEIGERLTVSVTVERVSSFERQRYMSQYDETVYVVTLRDEHGNALVVMSPGFHPEQGASLTIKGTVKKHSSYRGENQTMLSRGRQ